MHIGADGAQKDASASLSLQVLVAFPAISNPGSHVYVTVSPTLRPVTITLPPAREGGTGHNAKIKLYKATLYNSAVWAC